MGDDKGVKHWVDGRNSWKLGLSGFMTKFRGYFIGLCLALPVTGVPFWWPQKIPKIPEIPDTFTIEVATFSIHLTVLMFISLTILFFYVRQRTHRSLEMKSELHKLTHVARDSICDLFKRTTQGKGGKASGREPYHEKKHLIEFSNNMCSIICRYFKTLIDDETLGCVIRLGVSDPKGDSKEIKYVTIGRSNLNKNRSNTSEPIPRSMGIPKFFLHTDVSCQGVLFYDDLKKASANGAYLMQKNDTLYKDEISKLVVAPINGWNGKKNDLIGLLYITSKTKKILKPKHVDLIKFSADCLSLSYTSILSRLLTTGSLSQLLEEK